MSMQHARKSKSLMKSLDERILILDGAMGTIIAASVLLTGRVT
jgi:methionine synthase I (cobalamin-dependent)